MLSVGISFTEIHSNQIFQARLNDHTNIFKKQNLNDLNFRS